MLIILIFFNAFSLTFQTVQTAIFCDNFLREIYLIDEDTHTEKVIATGWDGNWEDPYVFNSLDVDPGALIKFKCYTTEGWSFGAGCFIINNKCRCYMFDNDIKEYTKELGPYEGTVIFDNNIECKHKVYFLNEFNIKKDYYYKHYIPLDVDGIKCMNDTVKNVPNNTEVTMKLSDYIQSSFKLTNLKISITENSSYFTLNNKKISSNDKFYILNNLVFFHNKITKIKIKFKSYGVVLEQTKTCELNIRICYDTCLECNDIDPNNNNHECTKCKNGFYFVENTNNCMTKEQIKDTNYYFDENDEIFKKCYKDCKHCLMGGDINDMKCLDCEFPLFLAEPNNCIDDITSYYYSDEQKKYIRCYKTCYICNKNSNEKNHNCKKCQLEDHFIYNLPGKCINKDERPANTYLDISTDTYRECYERCSTCDKEGNINNNNCKECLKIEDNYIYHFIYNENGKCISEEEKPSDTYLDIETNTYRKCYQSCQTCESFNYCNDCAKDKSNKYIYHFIENEKGKCINEEEKPFDTYLDIETNTYRKCSQRCQTCDSFNYCTECAKDEFNKYIYHFIENEKGKCISERELDTLSILGENDNMYKLCPEGTIKVENNQCIKSKKTIFIIIFLIILIIILILLCCIIRRMKRRRNNKINEMKIMDEVNDISELTK